MKFTKKRSIVLIDNKFQLRLSAIFIALQIFLTSLFAFGLYIFIDSEVHTSLASAQVSLMSLSKMMVPLVTILALFNMALSIVLVVIFVIIVSHKIAGPMYRFRTVLESLSKRHFDPFMKIRPDDQLGELAISIDNAVSTVKTDLTALQVSTENLKKCHENSDKDGMAAEIKKIEDIVSAWKA